MKLKSGALTLWLARLDALRVTMWQSSQQLDPLKAGFFVVLLWHLFISMRSLIPYCSYLPQDPYSPYFHKIPHLARVGVGDVFPPKPV